ncbi:MAG: Gfo/Idh/MocA family oxidoreductase [Verrucomicrobiales bacterium]|nr:Gfo/Idh/MocA family oxidoreductase [Verrucomicrobiales bacterium]
MTNVGVIGLGFMGLTHLKAYRKVLNARIAAICDAVRLPEDGNLSGIAGNIADTDALHFDMSEVKGYRDYREMLANPDIQLVDICVPTPLHAAMAIDALEAGKHVLCEKPLARDTATCRRIVEAATKAKGFFMPAMCLRFWPEWAWLKQAIDDRRFGKVLSAAFERLSEPPAWSQGSYFKGSDSGGALLDLHIHDTDFIQFCFGRPKSVFATGQTRFSGAIDHVTTIYHVECGASVTAEGSWLMHKGFGFKMGYRVNFENATVDYDSRRGPEALKVYAKDQDPEVITCDGGDGYIGELTHMVDSIEKGTPPSVVTGLDGMTAVTLCEAEEKSVETGQVVSIPC